MKKKPAPPPSPAPIAIIGLGLRLPGADSLDGFWTHLAAGLSLIGEVPRRRWDKDEWRGNPARENKTNAIWGGFVEDADGFDAEFFAISPREAAWMDPQQRFALEMAWHAIEDAGYSARALAGSRTGVFVGVCHWDYAELLEKHLAQVDAYTPTGIAFSIIANRVSHFFDLRGPSVTNDTACAASATALHDAVRALWSGDCTMALAGGVNLIWSPNHFVAFAKAGMLSKTGRARAFEADADGYVRGEGGAMLLLKPLDRALADGDPIHAVIRNVGLNHGGRTNSLTVTNPAAQADLIVEVHQGAGIDPASVSYIEAHGPGTPLGDPIEIAGLKQAFARLHAQSGSPVREKSCGIGSVKTNIGHLEGAAGIAGLVKVIAALRHGLIPANVGFETLNPLIDLSGTPFRIQAEATPWPSDPARPRRATVSSFGFGGSNAHLVVEEAPVPPSDDAASTGPLVLPLSAKDESRLAAQIEALRAFVAARPPGLGLDRLAYTLQTGREAFEARWVLVASNWDEALRALAEPVPPPPAPDSVAARWLAGETIDWAALWPVPPRRLHGPLTQFRRLRHWMDEAIAAKDDSGVPHPLLHRNLSGFGGVHFRTRLKGPDYVWADHHVGGIQVLPGMVALEMARAAAILSQAVAAPLALEDVVWARPVRAQDGPTELDVRLTAAADGVAFAITETGSDGPAHCQGLVRRLEGAPGQIDPTPPGDEVAVDQCYARLRASGIEHGPAFQALAKVHGGEDAVLAVLRLPRRLHPTLSALPLHPVLLDAAIQAWVALGGERLEGSAVPFACRRVEVHGPCEPVMTARLRLIAAKPGLRRLDIELADKSGAVRVVLRDLALRLMTNATETTASPAGADRPLLASGEWLAAPLPPAPPRRETLVVLAGLDTELDGAVCRLPPAGDDLAATAALWFSILHDRLVETLRASPLRQVLVLAADDLSPALLQPLAALLKTARAEQPRLDAALVRVADPARAAAIVALERGRADGWPEIRHGVDGERSVWRPVEIAPPPVTPPPLLRGDATYWITGGLGGLGQIFARWLVERGAGRVVLSGRGTVAADDPRLTALGDRVVYRQCDVTDQAAVAALVGDLISLRGVVHAAGLLDDGYILTRDSAREAAVLAPKLAGTVAIDRATAALPLDFLLLCSSVASVFGNPGQGGYGAANGFLDGFAQHRAAQVASGERQGRTVAIAWPLWAEGGMTVDAASLAALHRRFGTDPMPRAAGLAALDFAISAEAPAGLTVLYGEPLRLRRTLAEFGDSAEPPPDQRAPAGDAPTLAQVQDFVGDILADVLRLDGGQIRPNRKLDEYGLDSIAIVEATNRLEEALGPLSKTLFFEYVDLAGIAAYLAAEHAAALARALGPAPPPVAPAQPARAAPTPDILRAAAPSPDPNPGTPGRGSHDIAIVGLSLHVAKASDQDAFWHMLANGLHGFEPYPADRWDHGALLHPERDVLGKTVVKTGCFLDDIAAFDPRYFRISQYEAELMSPEVRLFLQSSVEAFEDAGYSRETLQSRYGGNVAVIMGSMTNEYDLFGFQNMLMRGSLASGSYTGTVPNMVSYYYGFTGPSYFLDTMCSTASTCVHEAVHMLRAGRCPIALAGSVSLLVHPQKLIATSQEHFTSKTAEVIRGYGLGADGTILGEGVGALVLKRLEDAERDGDHIYGVIRGTAVNNAGIRNGFTVPNPHQQAAAIEQALDDAGLSPATITYVEGHGSGTALGDPIEVRALTQVWRKQTDAVQTCPIGTVKSNIAHLLAASGLAGIAKVLMQFKHGQLAPSLHAETLNPNIAFDQTPFRVQRALAPWPRLTDETGVPIPRRAGITSIGAGGMNAHIVIEEHIAPPAAPPPPGPALLVVSAMSEASLLALVRRLLAHLDAHPEQALADLAYTLQVGRNQLPCRLAVLATDRADAVARLKAVLAAPGAGPGRWYTRSILESDPVAAADPTDPSAVAAAWISGAPTDWEALHRGQRRQRLSLPSYPFERVRCWYQQHPDAPSVVRPLGAAQKLHPFVGRNCSDLTGLRYATSLYLSELLDYVFKRGPIAAILPTVAIEAVAAVARIAGLAGPLAIRDLTVSAEPDWTRARDLTASTDGTKVALAIDGTPWVAARLEAGLAAVLPPPIQGVGEPVACYDLLRDRGLDFAPYLEGIEQAHRLADGSLLCRLRPNPPQQDHGKRGLELSAPALGAAFQALTLLDGAGIAAIEQVTLTGSGAVAQVLARKDGPGRFALWFLAEDGGIVAAAEGMCDSTTAATAPDNVPRPAAAPKQTSGLAEELRALVAEMLKFPPEQVGLREAFYELGFDSISLARLATLISTTYAIKLSPAVFFEAGTLEALAAHLASRHGVVVAATPARPAAPPPAQPARTQPAPTRTAPAATPTANDKIAIVGMAGRFPGAEGIDRLFDRLLAGDDLTGPSRDGKWRGGFLSDIDRFDAALFRVSPVEAERMDPQQRLMLETAWRALEDAGYRPDELPADCGVFVGASALDYASLLRQGGAPADGYDSTGNSLAMIANRVSHAFNLHGPSETIDTACSSSLVALLRAAEALRRGTCRAALIGGVNLALADEGFDGPAQAGMLSPDGRCKAFGATADGYGRGEGIVVVLAKRLAEAEADGDRILGVLIGGAENHGGRAGALTAPSVAAQAALVQTAMAGIDPRSVSYIEAHGTGTQLGDPVEINGLRRAYEALLGGETVAAPFIALGTVKSNIGHLEAAAGLAGLVKVLAAMGRGMLPASLHCTPPNPYLDLGGSPFRLQERTEPWPAGANPRRAGISSFGFGGANAHVVVEEHRPASPPRRHPLPPRRFADTRFWLPGTRNETVIVVPDWRPAALCPGASRPGRRLAVGAGLAIAAGGGAEVTTLPAEYKAAARDLLLLLQRTKGDTLVQVAVPDGPLSGLAALLESAALERPGLAVQTIAVEPGLSPEALSRLLADEAQDSSRNSRVRYRDGQRLARTWREWTETGTAPWPSRGVVLITGGMGGLGRLLARSIARDLPGAVLILCGSRPEDAERAAFLAELRALGAVAVYRQTDIADAQAVSSLIGSIVEVHGRLDLVFHCAGTLRDGLIGGKSADDLAAVLAPKVAGTEALLRACAGRELAALVLFSSLAGAVGNIGQADYAAANGYLAALAEARGLPLVAIDWPLWAEGGMRADVATRDALFERMGQRPLSTEQGLTALGRILAARIPHAAVLAGDGARIRTFFAAPPAPATSRPKGPNGGDETDLIRAVTTRLRALFAQAGGFAADTIHADIPLDQYGIDSLMIARLNAALDDGAGPLPKTLFFQHRTLAALAQALVRDHGETCRRWTGSTPPAAKAAPLSVSCPAVASPAAPAVSEPIAIIGLAGRYPGADDLDGFWANLAGGIDAVGEIAPERWALDGFFEPDRDEAVANGQSYAKWGAFLDGFADFDPLFFRLSPREAAAMDPQERLFLMSGWAAVEDAGYSPKRLAAANPVGVFVGVTKTGFARHRPFVSDEGALIQPSTSFASIANRLSHALDLTGPSLPIDTMCSASATALHLACAHLRAGRMAMALVGGVNLYLHPSSYVDLSAARMLSPSGRCKAFGAGADGFVPGEGVGCVVLKPLGRALADGDHIHAVIRGSAINHGGHSNGYTVPDPAAQRDVIRAALADSGLGADAVSYVEAHGTGTDLGDPIELAGLTQAFGPDGVGPGACALGSVKSNIGHLEAAAGLAGLTKVILALRHRALPPTLHAETVNPNLDLDSSPFRLTRRLVPWSPTGPRIAGISSFGAGGANAHLIVAEAPPQPAAPPIAGPQAIVLSARTAAALRRQVEHLCARLAPAGRPTLAAGLADAVRAELARLLAVSPGDIDGAEPFDSLGLGPTQRLALRGWLEARLGRTLDPALFAHLDSLDRLLAALGDEAETAPAAPALADIAWTLQIGREAMEHRLGVVVDSVAALESALSDWLGGKSGTVQSGVAGQHRDILGALGDDAALSDIVARWWERGELDRLLSLWVKGIEIAWEELPRPARPAIVSLPTYPFERQRFWLPVGDRPTAAIATPNGDAALRASSDRLENAIARILAAILPGLPPPVPELARWRAALDDLLAATKGTAPTGDPWAAWRDLRQSGGPAAQMDLAEATLRALPDILAGRVDATAVMFPEGRLGLVEATYKDDPVAVRFSRTLAEAAASFVRAAKRPTLRILEIGAGTGGTSERLFEALAPVSDRIADYCYTDLSRAFLIHAERRYKADWPCLTTALFDVEQPLEGQAVAPHGYDLVVAANVLHATADIARTLGHVRDALAPGGLLLLNETSRATLFTHVTFGLLEGWWRATDPERRIPGTPALTAQSWRVELEAAGLEWVGGSTEAERALGQQIVAARAPMSRPDAIAIPAAAPAALEPGQSLRARLLAVLGEVLNLAPTAIDLGKSFADYGLDSILGAELVHKLRRTFGPDALDHTALFDHSTVPRLEAFLAPRVAAVAPTVSAPAAVKTASTGPEREPVAIVGYSGRFAGSPDAEALWRHLVAGDDLVEEVSRFDLAPLYRDAPPGSYGRHGSFIEGIEAFDPVFFGISGLEATYMDPQQRLFLEEAWKTLDHAGHAGADIHGRRVGVFVGCASGDYHDLFEGAVPGQAFWGNTSSLIPARIAYFLDLKGPALAVDTACSSSLVAVHLACQSLWNGESEMALAGGVFIQSTPRFFRSANQANMLSGSGRCAAFGRGADGIVPGEAVGAVLLRPLSAALVDGDTIHGVILASGINQDGTTNGITAPSAASQERLLRTTYAAFGVDPASIGLIEAHGTGTKLGDPIEHAALARMFGPGRPGTVALGSVKSNIGHATTAAGIAGLLKVLLSLRHATIPPSLHFDGGNPDIRFEDGPFAVNAAPLRWTERRRAGISSFGFSGTNAHVVVEAPPPPAPLAARPGPHPVVLSARTPDLLRDLAARLADHIEADPGLALADIAFTLIAGRRPLRHRLGLVAAECDDLTGRLRRWLNGDAASGIACADISDSAAAPLAPAGSPQALVQAFLRGERLPTPETGHRVPLPTTRFVATRCWVRAAPPPPAEPPSLTGPSLPLRLGDPTRLAGPFVAAAAARVTLSPLEAAPTPAPAGSVRLGSNCDGVRTLSLTGGGAGLESALAQASADETVRVLLLEAEAEIARPGLLLDCPLPVVATNSKGPAPTALADSADFAAAPDEAAVLARRIAAAPRQALIELKRAMRRAEIPEAAALWPSDEAPSPGPAQAIALTSSCVALSLYPDGTVVLEMTEREHKNVFTDALMDGLSEAFATIARLDPAKVVVLTGFNGYFACGGTREGLDSLQRGETRFTDRTIYTLPLDCPLPVIAAMQGHAIGAGWSLGMFCDLTFFAAEAVYHSNYLWYGFTPGAGATLIFPHRLGDRLGREVLFSAHDYRGRDLAARRPDLKVLPGAEVGPAALALAHGLARLPAERLRALKAAAAQPIRDRLDATFARELAMHETTFIGNPRVQERIAQMFPAPTAPVTAAPAAARSREALRAIVIDTLAEDLMIAAGEIADGANFLDLGLDSILALTWVRRLGGLLGTELPATIVYAHPTVGTLIDHLAGLATVSPAAPISAPVPAPVPPAAPSGRDLRAELTASLAEELMIAPSEIGGGTSFVELGLDSILALTWVRRLNTRFGLDLPATAVYAHPTLDALAAHIATQKPVPAPVAPAAPPVAPAPAVIVRRDRCERSAADAVAIIGASGRFPGGRDLAAFWEMLRAGRDCIAEVPPSRWDVERFYHPDPLHPGTTYCKWMGAIDEIECFDAGVFTITPREAELMDPQQRLFLEHAWHAIEDAGIDPAALGGSRCGVFVGAGASGYADLIDEHNAYSLLGRSSSILAARISHLLDLRGPALSLDTACSSSLVAIAEACNALLVGDSDLALAGGVSVMIGPEMFIDTAKVGMLSKDGRCYSFDHRANGFVPGEGVGVLLLKRLEEAERDHDPIHAVIRGWGVNQDGRTNGIAAPNPQAQTRLISDVHRRFGIDPASIGLIECHGTGTPLGDPIEIEGLTDAFAEIADRPGTVALGSVKSNVGHLLGAAGVAGAIKAMLAVEHGEIPPTIQFEQLNEHIRLSGTPLRINTALSPWPGDGPRRAGVSSFGFSGTNAHLVLESAPPRPTAPARPTAPLVFVLSARSRERLVAYATELHRFVAARPELDLAALALTLQVGRKALPARLAFVFADRDSLLARLAAVAAGQVPAGCHWSESAPGAAPPPAGSGPDALAAAWAGGATVEWPRPAQGRRLHLPGYPFARDRHWVETAPPAPVGETASPFPVLAALTLPDLARAAAESETGRTVRDLRHVVWGRRQDGERRLEVAIDRDALGLLFRIVAEGAEATPCAVGEISEAPAAPPPPLPVEARTGGDDVTAAFHRFAPEARAVRAVWRQGGDWLARIELDSPADGFDPAALTLAVRLAGFARGEAALSPLAVERIALFAALPATILVRVRRPADAVLSITLFDPHGQPCLCLDGLRLLSATDLPDITLEENTTS